MHDNGHMHVCMTFVRHAEVRVQSLAQAYAACKYMYIRILYIYI